MAKQLTAELPFGRVSNQRLYFVNGKLSTVHLIETPGAYFKEAVVLYTQQTGVFFSNCFNCFFETLYLLADVRT